MVEVYVSSFIPAQSLKIFRHCSTAQSQENDVCILIKMFVVKLPLFFHFASLCKYTILPGNSITDETEDCYFADFAWSILQRDEIHSLSQRHVPYMPSCVSDHKKQLNWCSSVV